MGVRSKNSDEENTDEILQLCRKTPILPDSVQACICLQHVQMGIHCLALIGILVAESHILDFSPFAGKRLEITVLAGVETVFLNVPVQFLCELEGLLIPACPVPLCKAVDAEGYGVNLLLGVERGAVRIDAPIDTALLNVIEVVDNEAFGLHGHCLVFLAPEQPECVGECP